MFGFAPYNNWREFIFSPEKTLLLPMSSPFASFESKSKRNKYASWVNLLRGKSGVYWYGWQYSLDELPIFYIGSSRGHLESTFTRHFSGVYSEIGGRYYSRSVVPKSAHPTVQAGVLLTTQVSAPLIESQMISAWYNAGVHLENRNIPEQMLSAKDIMPSGKLSIQYLYAAKKYLELMGSLMGKQGTKLPEYRSIIRQVAELEYVPF